MPIELAMAYALAMANRIWPRFGAEDAKRKAEFVALSHEHLITDLQAKSKLALEDAGPHPLSPLVLAPEPAA